MKKITSTSQYIKRIVEITACLNKENDLRKFWFRGEPSLNYKNPIVPNSYRVLADTLNNVKNKKFFSKNIKEIESNIHAEFYRKASTYLTQNKTKNTKANRYFLMQHYGIPTRLLDWSENALIALFFCSKLKFRKKE